MFINSTEYQGTDFFQYSKTYNKIKVKPVKNIVGNYFYRDRDGNIYSPIEVGSNPNKFEIKS